jgi:mono/diheme cytochrome c family protein
MKPGKLLIFMMLSVFLFLMSGCGSDETVYLSDYGIGTDTGTDDPGTDNPVPDPDPDPDPDPTPVDPDTLSGVELYDTYCASCHGDMESTNIIIISAEEFQTQIDLGTGGMGSAELKALSIANLTTIENALNGVVDGEYLYNTYCASCHMAKENTTVIIKDAVEFDKEIDLGTGGMGSAELQALTMEELEGIADYLNDDAGGEEPGGEEPDGEALYAAYCNSCHGSVTSTTVDTVTPEAFASAITNNTGGMGSTALQALTEAELTAIADYITESNAAPDGTALYNTYCRGCHGSKESTDISTTDPAVYKSEIDMNTGGMGSTALQALTDAELAAIAAYLSE